MRKPYRRGETVPDDFLAGERRSIEIRFPRSPQSVIFFPAPYPAAIANLGFLTIWERLNTTPDFSCDRAIWDPRSGAPLRGLQSGISLSSFPLIFVSSSFELDLAVLIDALLACGIEPETGKRSESDPIIVAGGIAPTLNPNPWGAVVDLVVLGEGEESVLAWLKIYEDWNARGGSKSELLTESSQLPYVWIADQSDRPEIRAVYDHYTRDPACSPAIHASGHFGECFLVEINRGCPRKCRFCAVCTAYPARFAEASAVESKIEIGRQALGAGKIGLVGAASGDHPKLKEIVRRITESGLEITLSSVRIERTDEELLELLVAGGVKTLTVAPEVGGEELRHRIGKESTDADLVALVESAGCYGLRRLRLYFLIGLPEPEPPAAIVNLVKRLHYKAPSSMRLDVRVSGFIPKPGTPWERAGFALNGELNSVKQELRSKLSVLRGVSFRTESTRSERLAALLSRGDSIVGKALIRSRRNSRPVEQELKQVGSDPEVFLRPAS